MILFSINNIVYFTCFLPYFVKQRENFSQVFKKEFFEKIYINREVVQEARHIAICVLGRRNEPINSSNVNEGFKE